MIFLLYKQHEEFSVHFIIKLSFIILSYCIILHILKEKRDNVSKYLFFFYEINTKQKWLLTYIVKRIDLYSYNVNVHIL